MSTAAISNFVDSLSRATRQFLLLTLLLSSAAIGGGIDNVPLGSTLVDLPSQLDHVTSDQTALIGQQDTLRVIKRLDQDYSPDAPWLVAAAAIVDFPPASLSLPVSSSTPTLLAVSGRAHTPRAPPA